MIKYIPKIILYILFIFVMIAPLFLGMLYLIHDAKISSEKATFCFNNGGMPVESYSNSQLCSFRYDYNNMSEIIAMFPETISDKKFCFSCWSDSDCQSQFNEVLRARGVHC